MRWEPVISWTAVLVVFIFAAIMAIDLWNIHAPISFVTGLFAGIIIMLFVKDEVKP